MAGGLLSKHYGWPSIFWFLAIFAFVLIVPLWILLPETSSHPSPTLFFQRRLRGKRIRDDRLSSTENITAAHNSQPKNTNSILNGAWASITATITNREILLLLILIGLVYGAIYAVMASIPSVFRDKYKLDSLGITYVSLCWSAGSILSAFSTGRLLDWNCNRSTKNVGVRQSEGEPEGEPEGKDGTALLLRSRMQLSLPFLAFTCATLVSDSFRIRIGNIQRR